MRGRSISGCALFLFALVGEVKGSVPSVLDLDKASFPLSLQEVPFSSRLGVNIHFLKDDAALDAAKSAGFSFVRMDLTWAAVEKGGFYDFSGYDSLLASLDARGMGVLWILDYGHPDHGGAEPRSSSDLEAFAAFAEKTAAHFRGHDVSYEIWNEPNLKKFLPDGKVYPQLLEAGMIGIRRSDPGAKVSTGGLSGFDYHFLKEMMPREFAGDADAIAIHPYRSAAPETVAGDLNGLAAQIRAQFGRDIPIWDTEWGYPSAGFVPETVYGDGHSEAGRKRQAIFAVRELLTVWVLGLPVAVWYDLRDDGSDPRDREANFGLLDQNGKDKTAVRAVRTLMKAVQGRLMGTLEGGPERIHAVKLEKGTDFEFIVWCDKPGLASEVRFSAKELRFAANMVGEEIRPTISGTGVATIAINEADGPVYFLLRRGS